MTYSLQSNLTIRKWDSIWKGYNNYGDYWMNYMPKISFRHNTNIKAGENQQATVQAVVSHIK